MFTSFGIDGLAFAAEALIGEAIGRGNVSRFRIATRAVLFWTAVFAVLNATIYLLFGMSIVRLMTDIETVRRTAEAYVWWSIAMPLVSSWAFSFDGIFIGATRTRTLRNSMFAAFAVFLIFAFGLSPRLGNHGLWLAFFCFSRCGAVSLQCFILLCAAALHDASAAQDCDRFEFSRPGELIDWCDLINPVAAVQ